MLTLDVNVLIDAYRADAPRHERVRAWLERSMQGSETLLLPGVVASGFLRIVTNRRVFAEPDSFEDALGFLDALYAATGLRPVEPGPGHWSVFSNLCRRARVAANLVPDAWLAAIALENRATLITADRGFGRYPGLRWRDPLDD